jgi:zinc/manganese transport system ATP-binding protein
MDIISAKNLAAGYKGTMIWHDVNLAVREGEFVVVLGPNGAGKTTFFRLLLGLNRPLNGELHVFGETPRRGNPKVGYVPQRHLIDSEMAIESLELVRLGINGNRWGMTVGKKTKQERDRAVEVLTSVGAADLAHRPLGTLSGGELQRVFLAEALAGNPKLLLLDEPLANLDVRRESDMVALVREVARTQGVTVLLIAHNINPLLNQLDRVIYVANGHVAAGKPNDVLTSESLSALYGTPVEVLHDSRGRVVILAEDTHHHHEEHHHVDVHHHHHE